MVIVVTRNKVVHEGGTCFGGRGLSIYGPYKP